MKHNMFRTFLTAAIALAVSVVPIVSFAAVNACNHLYIVVGSSWRIERVDADTHCVTETIEKECRQCGEKITEENSYIEGHSYTYDYDTFEWVCQCGDSYRN